MCVYEFVGTLFIRSSKYFKILNTKYSSQVFKYYLNTGF